MARQAVAVVNVTTAGDGLRLRGRRLRVCVARALRDSAGADPRRAQSLDRQCPDTTDRAPPVSALSIVGLITGPPHVRRRDAAYNPTKPCRHFIQSPAFAACVGRISEVAVFEAVAGYCGSQGGGPLGAARLILTDDNGDQHRFIFEAFFNRYDALTLGVYSGPELRMLAASA
jgi:hypothetical protein